MRPLILDNVKSSQIIALKEFADKNRIEFPEMMQIMHGDKPPIGDRKGYSLSIEVGYRIVFSIEQHPKGWALHLSMSVNKPGSLPNETAVAGIMQILGFKRPIQTNVVYQEPVDPGLVAINVLEWIEPERVSINCVNCGAETAGINVHYCDSCLHEQDYTTH